jgi:hypothetical protein
VGYGNDPNGQLAVRWTIDPTEPNDTGTMYNMGDLPGGQVKSQARGVSSDGSVIVGEAYTAENEVAFIWKDADDWDDGDPNEMRNLEDVLVNEYGLIEAGDWNFMRAEAVSDDGKIITGYGRDPVGYYATWVVRLNYTPEVVDDHYPLYCDTTLSVAAPGVLENDTDGDSDTLTATKLTDPDPNYGTLAWDPNGNGAFGFTPDPDNLGSVTFDYQASDGYEDCNATVTVTITGSSIRSWSQTDKVTAEPNASSSDEFGSAVAIDSTRAVFGAPFDDDGSTNSGSAFIFDCDANDVWSRSAMLRASDAGAEDRFGYSVSVNGDTAFVGAIYDDDEGTNKGAVYVFEYDDGNSVWEQSQKLTESTATQLGYSVCGDGQRLIAGTSGGKAYIYEPNETTGNWDLQETLSSAAGGFGRSVSISGDAAAVGAPLYIGSFGKAFVYEPNETTGNWDKTAELIDYEGGEDEYFGTSVSISNDVLAVGSPGAYVLNPAGAVLVYEPNETTGNWEKQDKLIASDNYPYDELGCSVSIDGDTIIAGAENESASSNYYGAAYFFRYKYVSGDPNYPKWVQEKKVRASDKADGDKFGAAVAISANRAVVGAPQEDPNSISNAGSGYIFYGNRAPLAADRSGNADNDSTLSDQVKGYDLDGDTLIFTKLTDPDPNHGTLTLFDPNDGSYTFDPNDSYTGDVTFTFDCNDSDLGSNTGTVTITVSD